MDVLIENNSVEQERRCVAAKSSEDVLCSTAEENNKKLFDATWVQKGPACKQM